MFPVENVKEAKALIVFFALLQNTRTEEPTMYSCRYNTSSELPECLKMRGFLQKTFCKRKRTKKVGFFPIMVVIYSAMPISL